MDSRSSRGSKPPRWLLVVTAGALSCGGAVDINAGDDQGSTTAYGGDDGGTGGIADTIDTTPTDATGGDGDIGDGDDGGASGSEGSSGGDSDTGDAGDTGDGDGDGDAGDGDGDAGDGDGDAGDTGDGDGFCGNGVVEAGESCDDANPIDGDGCNQDCRFSAVLSASQHWDAFGAAALEDAVLHAASGRISALGSAATASEVTGLQLESLDGWASVESDTLDAGPGQEFIRAAATDGSLGLVVGGVLTSPSQEALPWVARYAADGVMLWSTTPTPATLHGQVNGVVRGSDDMFIVAGDVHPTLSTASDRWLAGLDLLGTVAWEFYEDSGFDGDRFTDVAVRNDGIIYAAGSVGSTDTGANLSLVALDASGQELWRWEADFAGRDDRLDAVTVSSDGRIHVAGEVRNNLNQRRLYLAAIDDTGALAWSTTTDGGGTDIEAHDLVVDRQDRLVVAGSVCAAQLAACPAMHVRKYTDDGTLMWARTGAGPGYAQGTSTAHAVIINDANEVTLVGSARTDTAAVQHPWVGVMTP